MPNNTKTLVVGLGEVGGALAEVLERLHTQTALLERAVLESELPDKPDRDTIDGFLSDAYQRVWAAD